MLLLGRRVRRSSFRRALGFDDPGFLLAPPLTSLLAFRFVTYAHPASTNYEYEASLLKVGLAGVSTYGVERTDNFQNARRRQPNQKPRKFLFRARP